MRYSFLALALAVPAFLALEARADWPQYRGPNRDGVVPRPPVVEPWQPEIAWRREIGEGFSAIAVVGSRLYTLDARDGREHAACFDANRGTERWRRDLGPAFPRPSSPASAPVTTR